MTSVDGSMPDFRVDRVEKRIGKARNGRVVAKRDASGKAIAGMQWEGRTDSAVFVRER